MRCNDSIMRICNFLGVKIDDAAQSPSDLARGRIERCAMDIWDGTPEDAERVVALLSQIAALRRS